MALGVKQERRNWVNERLNTLEKTDVYSLMLFTLYKLRDIPEYTALTELSYILDGSNLSKFLSFYGGMTLKIPTLKDMRLMIQALLLFQLVNLEEASLEEGLKVILNNNKEFSRDELINAYDTLLLVSSKYEFKRN